MIINEGTRDATLTVMECICQDQGDPQGACNENSAFIRRHASVTFDKDHLTQVDEYGVVLFPALHSMSGLGIGLDWTRVCSVVIMCYEL